MNEVTKCDLKREDIIRIAKEAWCGWAENGTEPMLLGERQIKRFANLVADYEREACAKVCFEMAQRHDDIRSAALEMASEYILARGKA